MSKFTPRKSAPSATDKHWIRSTKGGLNACLEISSGSVLPNCVGYAWGRFYELTGEKPRLSTGNAENWYGNTADGYKRSATPKLGAVACWRKGQAYNESDGCGHVAVVEEIKSNGDIVCSNSAYKGSRFYMKTYSKSAGYNDGALAFQGFILPPVDFEGSSVDELAREVVQRLNETECDWNEVRERVTELLSAQPEIKVGDTVMVQSGAKTYNGGKLASFVYTRPHKVTELVRDRAVISYNGAIVAAVNVKDLSIWR